MKKLPSPLSSSSSLTSLEDEQPPEKKAKKKKNTLQVQPSSSTTGQPETEAELHINHPKKKIKEKQEVNSNLD